MAEDEGNKEKRFDFTAEGEVLGYLSLDQAVLQARRLARQDGSRYLQRLGWDEIVWMEISADQREDSYRVVLQFRRPARGLREEQTGEEEFLFDLTGGLQDRQVLLWPEGGSGDDALDPSTTPREPDVSATPVPEAAYTPRELGPPVTPDTQPGAVEQPLEPAAPVAEGIAPSGIPASDPSASPVEELETAPDTASTLRCPH